MKKIMSILFSLLFIPVSANAESITKTITSLGVNKSAVSVSVKDIRSGNVIYSLNEKAPMLPASTLKLVTSSAAIDTLGAEFQFLTKLYKSTNNDLYLQLSGDPLLTSDDLEQLIGTAKTKNIEPKTFYVDDTVFDREEWGEGWQWDDDLNPLMPKFSAYNIGKNLVKIEITPTANNMPAKITVKPFYPLTFMNMVKTDTASTNSIKIDKNNTPAPNMLNVSGVVSKLYNTMIPVSNPKMNFGLRLEEALRNKKLEYYAPVKNAKLPDKNIYLVDQVSHNLEKIMPAILKNSDNLAAETLFKTAGAVYSKSQGSRDNSMAMLKSYLDKINIVSDDVKIVDGSGVSKNNLMTADFMTDFLVYRSGNDDFDDFKSMLPAPGEGTLKNRMLYLKDSMRAKTGTLSDTSSIAGYITSRRGKTYAFDIMINDAKTSPADKKNIEEQILRNIYANY